MPQKVTRLGGHQPILQGEPERITQPSDNVKTLFVTRMCISMSLIITGLIVLSMGYQLLITDANIKENIVLLNIANGFFQLTLKGFAAVMMLLSIIPFVYAYKALPDRRRGLTSIASRSEK